VRDDAVTPRPVLHQVRGGAVAASLEQRKVLVIARKRPLFPHEEERGDFDVVSQRGVRRIPALPPTVSPREGIADLSLYMGLRVKEIAFASMVAHACIP
jgi:hypothetical protein